MPNWQYLDAAPVYPNRPASFVTPGTPIAFDKVAPEEHSEGLRQNPC